jgi:hypothetical protein
VRWFGVRRLLLCERLLRGHDRVLRDGVSDGFRDMFPERPAGVYGRALQPGERPERCDVRGVGVWRLLL